MKHLSIILCICVALEGIIASPYRESSNYDDTQSRSTNNFKVNLNYLGDKIYGLPSSEAGTKLQNWRKGDKVNPEELGDYAEGDILFSVAPNNGLASESSRWPEKIIPYDIIGRLFTLADREMIQSAINDFHQYSCLRFVPRTNERVYIRITSKVKGCYSSVGYTGYSYNVNLQTPGCTWEKGTVLHELLHAVGFVHEQSRSERDNYVTIFEDNIKDGESFNFGKYPMDYLNDFGVPYDYKSVMHYSAYAFSRNGEKTIAPKSDSDMELGQRDGFSEGDIKKLNAMYQCNEAQSKSNDVRPQTPPTFWPISRPTYRRYSTERPFNPWPSYSTERPFNPWPSYYTARPTYYYQWEPQPVAPPPRPTNSYVSCIGNVCYERQGTYNYYK